MSLGAAHAQQPAAASQQKVVTTAPVSRSHTFNVRESALRLETPLDFNRFPKQRQDQIFDWIALKLQGN
jgi:hypothetical protein